MLTMVKLSHFNVEVLQDGAATNEYADRLAEESLNTKTKYIEIKERKSFIVRLTVDKHFRLDEYDALSVEVSIDGKYVGGICYEQHSLMKCSETVELIEGFTHGIDGKTSFRTFRFEEAEMSRKFDIPWSTANPRRTTEERRRPR